VQASETALLAAVLAVVAASFILPIYFPDRLTLSSIPDTFRNFTHSTGCSGTRTYGGALCPIPSRQRR